MKKEKYEKVDEYFFYLDLEPMRGSEELCKKLAILCNEKKRHLIDMNENELQTWVKPIFVSCGVTWLELPDT